MRPKAIGAAILGAQLAVAGPLQAQDTWAPESTVEIIVGFSAGGGVDRVARLVQTLLDETGMVGHPVNVVNRPGAGGGLAAATVANAEPDGHTIGFSNIDMISTPLIDPNVPSFDEMTPLGVLSRNAVGFAVPDGSPIETPQDIVDALKEDPASLSFVIGTAIGNQNHIAVAQVADAVGVNPADLRVIVVGGGGETVTSVLGGHVDVGLTSVQNFLPHVGPDGLRIVAVSSTDPIEGLDVPTWTSLGINSVAGPWFAVYGPPGMSDAQISFWEDALFAATQTERWQTYLKDNLVANAYRNAADARAFMAEEEEDLERILTSLGIIEESGS